MNRPRILAIGGSSILGSHLGERWLARGEYVLRVDHYCPYVDTTCSRCTLMTRPDPGELAPKDTVLAG